MPLTNLIGEIKQNARLILQKRYGILLLIFFILAIFGVVDHMQIYSLIFSFISLTVNIVSRICLISFDPSNRKIMQELKDFDYKAWTAKDGVHVYQNGKETINSNPEASSQLMAFIFALTGFVLFMFFITAIALIFAFIFKTFLTNPILVGKNRYLLKLEQGKEDVNDLFFSFTGKSYYLNTVKTMVLKDIFVWLWTLLLVIPGVIKNLSYFMVPYIISENPNIPSKRAFDISKAVMEGEKWNLFVIYLSFFGWMLLGTYCTCGIGFYFLLPYLETTMMEYYIYLKNKAFKMNIINENELEYRPFHYNNAAFQNG